MAMNKGLPADGPELPSAYGEDRIVLLVRDPWTVFAYWEATPARAAAAREELRRRGSPECRPVLRIYETGRSAGAGTAPVSHFDVELENRADNRYVRVKPDRTWFADIGFRGDKGDFVFLARSNRVITPRFGVCEAAAAGPEPAVPSREDQPPTAAGRDEKPSGTEEKKIRGWMFSPGGAEREKGRKEAGPGAASRQLPEWMFSPGFDRGTDRPNRPPGAGIAGREDAG